MSFWFQSSEKFLLQNLHMCKTLLPWNGHQLIELLEEVIFIRILAQNHHFVLCTQYQQNDYSFRHLPLGLTFQFTSNLSDRVRTRKLMSVLQGLDLVNGSKNLEALLGINFLVYLVQR